MSDLEMTCKQLVELVTEYFEGTLSASDRARFGAHLETCSDCVVYVDQMRQTAKVLGSLHKGTLPESRTEELLRVFREWKQAPGSVECFELGTPGHAVPPGSHMVNYYRTERERDDFALRYLTAGLQAGENCVILGDPLFVGHAARLLQTAEPADGWPGRLFTAPWDRAPSFQAVQEFVELHRRIGERGPSGLLPEVPMRRKSSARGTHRVRGLGNFRHWSRTEPGCQFVLQICAIVEQVYRGGRGIVVCQWEALGRSAAFRWGALAVHTHMVNGTCIARPSEALERYVQGAVAGLEGLLATLRTAKTRGEVAEVPRAASGTESALAEIQHFVACLDG